MTSPKPTPPSPLVVNRLLAALPRAARARLAERMETVELGYGQVLYRPGEIISHVYFPLDCLVSLLTEVDRRKALEVGMVGPEGVVGVSLALGVDIAHNVALVQGNGTALRMTAAQLRAAIKAVPAFQAALLRYSHLLLAQVAQTAACNRFHATGARLARWLLMTCDRLHTDRFTLTQAVLADMLGVRRAGVSIAASAFEDKRLIGYKRGNIHIRDRAGLEDAACTCYRAMRDLQDEVQA